MKNVLIAFYRLGDQNVKQDLLGCIFLRTDKTGAAAVQQASQIVAEYVTKSLREDDYPAEPGSSAKRVFAAGADVSEAPEHPSIPEEYLGRWLEMDELKQLQQIQLTRLKGMSS